MTWGYWGIVSVLLVLVGVFFACMEILYARARNGGNGKVNASGESAAGTSKGNKHAA